VAFCGEEFLLGSVHMAKRNSSSFAADITKAIGAVAAVLNKYKDEGNSDDDFIDPPQIKKRKKR